MRITLAQIEPITGDLEGNTRRILEVIQQHDADSDVIVFPEMAVTGYNCGADFECEEFVQDAWECIEKIIAPAVGRSFVLAGAPTFASPMHERNGSIRIHNTALLMHEGKVAGQYHKRFLANDSHHEDRKYFLPGPEKILTFEAGGSLCGVLICEDIWAHDHERDLAAEMKLACPGLSTLFVLNYSYFTSAKQPFRMQLLQEHALRNRLGMVYLNAVGIGDIVKNIICYDGGSWAVRADGSIALRMPEFEEAVTTIHFEPYALQCGGTEEWPDFGNRCSRLWAAMCYTTRRMYDIPGIACAQVHVSGGLDSALVAVLAVKALGSDRVTLITNPSRYNGEELLATGRKLAEALQTPLHVVPVQNFSESLLLDMDADARRFGRSSLPSAMGMVRSTVDAVGRTVIGLAECHYNHAAVLATGNHTENVLGWANFHDIGSIGLFQPIGDLTKTELFELARWINEHYDQELIPAGLYNGEIKPAAELADAKEDPFDYALVSGICAEIIRHRKTRRGLYRAWREHTLTADYFPDEGVYDIPEALWQENVDMCWKRSRTASVFKCAQAAPILILSPRSRGFSSRETIITRYKG